MYKEYAQIIIHRQDVPYGASYDTYDWEGARNLPVRITGRMDTPISFYPWPLKVLDYEPQWDGYICIRTDVHFWWITYLKNEIRKGWDWFYYRMLATARIWGLADWSIGCIPSWRDLKPVTVIREWFHA